MHKCTNREPQVTAYNIFRFAIMGCVTSKLKHLCCEIFEDSGVVDYGGAHSGKARPNRASVGDDDVAEDHILPMVGRTS